MSPSSNQAFSLPRFGRLFGRHTAEHLPSYAMATAVLAGFLLLIMGLQTYSNGPIGTKAQAGYFVFFLLMAAIIFTSGVFSQYGEKRQATVALLLPASHFEKFLVAWLYSVPIFLLVFAGVFYLVDLAVLYLGAAPGQTPEVLNIFASSKMVLGVLTTLALLHSAWLVGAIYFEKTHFVKTGFAVFVLLAVVVVLNFQALKLLISPALRPAPPFSNLTLMEGTNIYQLTLPEAQTNWLAVVPVALALLLWGASYFRLTEKQL